MPYSWCSPTTRCVFLGVCSDSSSQIYPAPCPANGEPQDCGKVTGLHWDDGPTSVSAADLAAWSAHGNLAVHNFSPRSVRILSLLTNKTSEIVLDVRLNYNKLTVSCIPYKWEGKEKP